MTTGAPIEQAFSMAILVAALTVSLLILYRDRLRHVTRWHRPRGGDLVDEELGLARLQLPRGWRAAAGLNDGACLQAMHPLHGRHVIVISESLEDYALGVTLHEHAEVTRNLLTRGIRVMKITGPDVRTVGGADAVQFEIEGFHDNTWLKYLNTTVAGRRAFHQVIGWATQSRYDRGVFEALLDGFAELPGSDAIRRPPPGLEVRQTSTRIH
jgi:dihydrofolate reductase